MPTMWLLAGFLLGMAGGHVQKKWLEARGVSFGVEGTGGPGRKGDARRGVQWLPRALSGRHTSSFHFLTYTSKHASILYQWLCRITTTSRRTCPQMWCWVSRQRILKPRWTSSMRSGIVWVLSSPFIYGSAGGLVGKKLETEEKEEFMGWSEC